MFKLVNTFIFIFLINLRSICNMPSMPDWNQYHLKNTSKTYSFGYDVEDRQTNNVQFRNENKFVNGSIVGSYGYLEEDGNIHLVHYVADSHGFRALIEDSKAPRKRFSPQMLAALESVKVFKKQQVLDEHRRPFSSTYRKRVKTVLNIN